jgi:2-(1,2-epoxy-1,2-dihydrophenyl)acetyl-CoA isomerase
VAAESASFALLSARLGVPPDSGLSWWLPRLAGPARARGLAMLGEALSARRAAEWGLIWECVPDDAFAAAVEARAQALAAAAPIGLALTREALRRGLEQGLEEQLEHEARLQSEAGATRDFLEGALAWSEGRTPRFEGR